MKAKRRVLSIYVLYDTLEMPTPFITNQKHYATKIKRNPREVIGRGAQKKKIRIQMRMFIL